MKKNITICLVKASDFIEVPCCKHHNMASERGSSLQWAAPQCDVHSMCNKNQALQIFQVPTRLRINASLQRYRLVCHRIQTSKQRIVFTFVFPSNLVTRRGKVLNIYSFMFFLKLSRHIGVYAFSHLAWRILISGRQGREKPHTDKYRKITDDWNYDVSCTLTSLPVWDLENFKHLIFGVQNVRIGLRAFWNLLATQWLRIL
jgi:hypothetical protein